MIIQCPDCASKYRIKEMAPGRADAHLSCPNCAFRFSLQAPKQAGLPPTVVPGGRVLLVDDARFFREMIVDLLVPINLNIRLAETAAGALTLLEESLGDLLVLDLNLPDKNGLDFISELRNDSRFQGLSILAISGVYRHEQDSLDAIRAGADGFISKSFRPAELSEKIRTMLRSH